MNKKMNSVIALIPGLALSLIIVIVCTYITKLVPKFGTATYAILLGILLGNTVFKQDVLKPGTAFGEKRLLELSVLLLGYSISVDSFAQIGFHGLFIIITMIVSTIAFVIWRGKKHRVSKNMGNLMASGNAICGSSAIAAVADVVDSTEQERSNSIVLINLSGTILMLLLPVIGGAVFGTDVQKNGLLIGSIVQSVGQVAGAGSQMGPEILEIAMVTKIIRVLMLVFVVLYFSSKNTSNDSTGTQKKSFLKFVPWYIIGFALMFAIRSALGVNTEILGYTKGIGNIFELTALAAIGLRLDLQGLLKNSKSLLSYVFETLAFQVVASIALITLVFNLFV